MIRLDPETGKSLQRVDWNSVFKKIGRRNKSKEQRGVFSPHRNSASTIFKNITFFFFF